MFKELFALAERAPVLLLCSREADKLRVNLMRKQDKDEKAVPLSISILATPEELDAELPLALSEGLAMTEAPTKAPSVADQVKAQVEASTVEPVVKKMTAAKPPRAAKPARTTKPKAVKPATAPKRSAPKPKGARGKAPLGPSPELAAVAGNVSKHNEAMTKVWDYIKANDLKAGARTAGGSWIRADKKLKALFGGKDKLASTQLAAIVKRNLVPREAIEPAAVVPKITPLLKPEPEDFEVINTAPGEPAGSVEADPESPIPGTVETRHDDAAPGEAIDACIVMPVTPAAPPQPEPAAARAPADPIAAKDAASLDLFS